MAQSPGAGSPVKSKRKRKKIDRDTRLKTKNATDSKKRHERKTKNLTKSLNKSVTASKKAKASGNTKAKIKADIYAHLDSTALAKHSSSPVRDNAQQRSFPRKNSKAAAGVTKQRERAAASKRARPKRKPKKAK